MVAVVLHHPKKQDKTYRIATENDLQIFKEAEKRIENKRQELMEKWDFDPISNEFINSQEPNK